MKIGEIWIQNHASKAKKDIEKWKSCLRTHRRPPGLIFVFSFHFRRRVWTKKQSYCDRYLRFWSTTLRSPTDFQSFWQKHIYHDSLQFRFLVLKMFHPIFIWIEILYIRDAIEIDISCYVVCISSNLEQENNKSWRAISLAHPVLKIISLFIWIRLN